jgi:1-acyl-sn-glycerol-3-phosphate acyltransferase
MQNVVIDKPYKFIPPVYGRFWPTVFSPLMPLYLDRAWGVAQVQIRGAALLRESMRQGHGIVLAPNHCRPCDPLVLGRLIPHIGSPLFAIASWHLFMQGGFTAWFIRRVGAFSIYREGMDKQAVSTAIDILQRALRPLVIFPEGVVTRTNDRLTEFQEGTAFIARTAAKKRAKQGGKVVLHPMALKYYFRGDLAASAEPVLSSIEHRLTWLPQRHLTLSERIAKLGSALLSLKEVEYLGKPQSGTLHERLLRLIDHILVPLEDEWVDGSHEGHVVARVKRLRAAILPDMVTGEIAEAERERRWRQLADMYLAQQLSWYPPDYVTSRPSAERLLETIERFDEDLTDEARIHRPLHCVIEIAEAIEVSPERDRAATTDPLLVRTREVIQGMLDRLAEESPVLQLPLPAAEPAMSVP